MRLAIVLYAVSIAYCLAARAADSTLLYSFEQEPDLQNIHATHARVSRLKHFVTDGHYALQVDFEATDQPRIEFAIAAAKSDWQPFGAIAVDATNPSDEPLGFTMEVEDAAGARTTGHTAFEMRPHESSKFALALDSPPPVEMGMRGEPLIPGFHLLAEDHHPIDLGHVAKIRIFLLKPVRPRTFVIDNLRLAPGVTYEKIVDAFGQFARAEWTGKLKTEADFARQRDKEQAELKAHPALPDRDEYGGWASGPQLEATGYFHTIQRDGKWWLVTPSGHLFFSLGFNAITPAEGDTVVEGREPMFQWLPASGDSLSSHYGSTRESSPVGLKIKLTHGRTFQFYAANLERKYGPDWRNAGSRLRSLACRHGVSTPLATGPTRNCMKRNGCPIPRPSMSRASLPKSPAAMITGSACPILSIRRSPKPPIAARAEWPSAATIPGVWELSSTTSSPGEA